MQVLDIDVGETIRAMDQQYGTQFEIWIRNEANIDCVVFYLRKFIVEFEDSNSGAITRAIRWIVQEWSVQKSAELLIKLFYHWGVGHPKFVSLVSELSHDWRMPLVVDLVATLVVGESSSNTAGFIQHFTSAWEPFMVIQLCRNIATRLRWNDRYCLQFLLRYATLTYPEGPTQRVVLSQIRNQFETRSCMLHHGYKTGPVDFTMTMLEVMVRDSKMYRNSHPKYATLPCVGTPSKQSNMARPLLHDTNLTIEEAHPAPRASAYLEKLSGPPSTNPNDGIILGLPIVDE
ncbi:hypothetical protein K493DRAFT_315341 [Basidiobolus meristosporus CBS 931.73]|uniref:Uncharacterized protein n=1 Tax=Basidiobolus meristosporus CBS 931.73 TaxID=1314790 RepID=A0A1Y1YAZ1_9FUNG|nr:hypothetical protein K493DRAFT_315341 [Basidiobolus meristosporus CBS 931.73]|eukprot:ORX94784.1 hypothetical protein K493DRAFT_315341 [Basidiobolus meristosporus CBS 931.73]